MNISQEKNVVILDANSIVHKVHKRADPVFDKQGNDQKVLYGLLNSILSMSYHLNKDIDELHIVFDPENSSEYRKSLFNEYKANRPEPDEDLSRQKRNAIKVLRHIFGLLVYDFSGFEADDTIGSLIKDKEINTENSKIWIFSPDKDISQLVSTNVVQFRKNKLDYQRLDYEKVKELFGVRPEQIPDWLALMGDTIDNISGIEKIGAVTAAKLLNKYLSIEHLIAIAHEMPTKTNSEKRIKEEIIKNTNNLVLYKKLATIKTDIEIIDYRKKVYQNTINVQKNALEYNKKLLALKEFCNLPNKFIEPFIQH